MAGEQAATGRKLTAAVTTTADDAFVALMRTIRSDIIKALQFIDQQPPMPAEAYATAHAVAWLRKNKDQLLHVIHNLATPEIEAAPAAVKTLTSVIHAHPLPAPSRMYRLLDSGDGSALMRVRGKLCVRVATLLPFWVLCAVCSASSAAKPTASRSK